MDDWGPADGAATGEPWTSFATARTKYHDRRVSEAIALWRRIADDADNESRSTLQAWHFLRQAGVTPPIDRAKAVLGVMAEMPMESGHDVLAAYRDGSVRYLNFSGKVAVVEPPAPTQVTDAVAAWFHVAEDIVANIGPWEEPALPDLPAGHLRVMMLTPSGPHFGQGPADALGADPMVGRFVTAAATLLQAVTQLAT
ncbi:MAG TPA: hypothetical protein VFV00_01060 [Acidimicrobiales bacterium]|nr:hypothetical protein [Acidimicrobiales bacterium]